jgi:PAS domain S-box-containing protein
MDPRSLNVLWWGLALMVAACLAIVGLGIYQAIWNIPALRRNQELVVYTFQVISTARAIERSVQDAELGQRNFLITGDTVHHQPYGEAVKKTRLSLAELKQLTSDNAGQHARVRDLERQIELRISELQRAMVAPRTGNANAILRRIRATLETETMRAVNGLIDAIVAAENDLLAVRHERAVANERRAANTAMAGGALALLAIVLGAFLVRYPFPSLLLSEKARRESEMQFRLLVDGVTDFAIFMLGPRGHVASWNAGAERIKGYSAAEILSRDFSCFYSEEDRQAGVPQRALDTARHAGRYEAEGWSVRKDGSRFWANVVIDRLSDPSGRLRGYAKITRDITERRRQQEALEQAQAALAQAQKMEALGQLTGGIAHDFNNLLTVISGAIEMIQQRLQDRDPDISRFIGAARRGTERAASLTQGLLAFARRQPLAPTPLDPNQLIAGVVDMVRRGLGEAIAIESVLAGGLWWVSADANQLESTVLNLVVNGRDAMPHGGKLTIETANAFLDGTYSAAHGDVVVGQYVMIAVSDTGTGMTKEVIARAFEPFFTTKEIGQGTGLGLSQVYGFVKQSNGHVNIYSEPGMGTTVKIYLPRFEGRPADVPADDRPVAAGIAGKTILVVEDDRDVREFAVETLAELGYRILVAGDANAALRELERETVDLLFTDLGLPGGIGGQQLADEARRRWPDLTVLFTTAYAPNAMAGRLDPDIDLISKPYTQSNLADRVRRLLDHGSGTAPGAPPAGG